MKILLLNQTFYPDVASTAQHLTDLALALTNRGHEVTVVSSRRAYDSPGQRFARRETWQGIHIVRVDSTGFGKAAKWRRAADFASFILACCLRLLTLPRHDVVVALTTPPLISFIGAWLAKLRGSRFYYWVMDLNPDEAIAAGWLRADSLAARILERMSRFSLRRADKIIALDRFMRAHIVAKGIPTGKIAVIPPWSHDDAVRFDAAGRERFRKAHGLDGKFVVMYSGNHSPVHPLDTLLATAEEMRNDARVMFCFVGGGSEFVRVQRFAAERRLTNILCLPYRPLSELADSLSAADLHTVVMGNPMVGLVHPCKIYNILSIGAPVLYLGPNPSHVTEIFRRLSDSHTMLSASHGEVDRVVEHIARLREQSSTVPRQIPIAVLAQFSQGELLPRLIAQIEAV